MDVPGEVLMIKVGEHVVLSLWAEAEFEAEVGPDPPRRRPRAVLARPQRAHPRGGRRGARDRPPGRRRPRARGCRAGVGWVHRLLRRPRRLPLGDRVEPGPDRTGGTAMTDKTTLGADQVAGEGLADWTFVNDTPARHLRDRRLRDRPAPGQPDRRRRRVGQPPPRPRADLSQGRGHPDQPRRRRGHQPRRRDGPHDQRVRGRGDRIVRDVWVGRARRPTQTSRTIALTPRCGTGVPDAGTADRLA